MAEITSVMTSTCQAPDADKVQESAAPAEHVTASDSLVETGIDSAYEENLLKETDKIKVLSRSGEIQEVQTFDTLDAVAQAITDFEESTTSNFIVFEKKKYFGDEAFRPSSKVAVHWHGPQVKNVSLSDYTGIPFVIARRKVLCCHLGKDLALPQKKRYIQKTHKNQVANIREKIDPRVINKILELYQSGIRKKRDIKKIVDRFVLQDIFAGLDFPESSRRRFYPTLKDILNLMSRISKGDTSSVFDQSKVLSLVSKWQQDNPNSYIYCRPHTSMDEEKKEQNFLFLYQTEWQKKLLSTYGNSITLLDATYRTTRYALPLYFLCVRTNVCYVVVAAFVVQQERTEYIEEALKMIKDCNPNWNPTSFMVDFCLEEINAIAHMFTGNLMQPCSVCLYVFIKLITMEPYLDVCV